MFAIADSTVSIAPKRITRSWATISSSESPRAGSLATALVTELSGRVRERSQLVEQDRVQLGAREIGAALRLGIAVVDHRARERLVEDLDARDVVERQPEHVAREPDRERRGEVLDELAAAARGQPLDQRVEVAPHGLREALAHGPHAERLVERLALALVLGAVAREHHHAERGPHEVRLRPDREVVAAPEQLACERVRRHEPAAERRHPRDGLRVAQAVERGRAAGELEIGELDRRAGRKARAAGSRLGVVDDSLCNQLWHAAMLSGGTLDHGRDRRGMRDLREVAGTRDDRHGRVQHARDAPSARDRHRAVARSEDDRRGHPHAREIAQLQALDAVADDRGEGILGAIHLAAGGASARARARRCARARAHTRRG